MVNRTGDYGVCVVSKPLNKQELDESAPGIVSAFRAPSADDAKGEQQAPGKAGRDAVCFRAKFLLISEQGMTEEAAHATSKKAPWTPGAPGKKCPWKLSQNTNKHRLEKRKTAAERKKLSAAGFIFVIL